jgi:endo-1,4-beta-xylanase
VTLLLVALSACVSEPTNYGTGGDDTRGVRTRGALSLREVAQARGLRVGAAVDKLFRDDGDGVEFKAVLSEEFSVLTPENDMKHRKLQPSRGVFAFARADSLVEFAEANGMLVRGHTLVWHTGNASWMNNGKWTPAELRTLIVDHVRTVVGHYRGRVFAWDVVNEVFDEDGTLRSTIYNNLLGTDYIVLAFRTAHEADPDALLFYNDNRIEGMSAKSDSAYALVSRLVAAGVPIHGIGLEGHFIVGRLPSRDAMAANLARYAALGLKVHFTEVDVRVPQPSTTESLALQAENYRDVFDVCLQNLACQMVVTWGVSDRETWIPAAHPGFGDPLLLDRSYQPKSAYQAVHNLLSGSDGVPQGPVTDRTVRTR